ncbi:hypothetical protein EAH79_11410 [Sphingomonas koreensis]|nr:hypothetical protein EAH79_11410 [Sphingomonas koreensis]
MTAYMTFSSEGGFIAPNDKLTFKDFGAFDSADWADNIKISGHMTISATVEYLDVFDQSHTLECKFLTDRNEPASIIPGTKRAIQGERPENDDKGA